MSFREFAYTLMDEDLTYLSPSSVYRILKKNDLITPWKHPQWASTRPEHAKSLDERWQTDIMYIKIRWRFFYLLIFIDEYSRYITHHVLLTSRMPIQCHRGTGSNRHSQLEFRDLIVRVFHVELVFL